MCNPLPLNVYEGWRTRISQQSSRAKQSRAELQSVRMTKWVKQMAHLIEKWITVEPIFLPDLRWYCELRFSVSVFVISHHNIWCTIIYHKVLCYSHSTRIWLRPMGEYTYLTSRIWSQGRLRNFCYQETQFRIQSQINQSINQWTIHTFNSSTIVSMYWNVECCCMSTVIIDE